MEVLTNPIVIILQYILVSQTIMFYTLNLHKVIFEIYLNKAGKNSRLMVGWKQSW